MSPRAAAFLPAPGLFCLSLAHFKYQTKFLQFVWISHLVSPTQPQHPFCASQKRCMGWKCASNHGKSWFLSIPLCLRLLKKFPEGFQGGGDLRTPAQAILQGFSESQTWVSPPNCVTALRGDVEHNENISKHLK